MRTAHMLRMRDVWQFDERVSALYERVATTRCVFTVLSPDLSETLQTLSVVARVRLL
jgi:hypothetical protein